MDTPGPVSRPTQPTRRVSKTFSHSAAPDDIRPGGVSFLELLLKRFPYHTTAEWTARIQDGRVTLNGAIADPETGVNRGDRLQYQVDDYEEPAVPIDFHEIRCVGDLALVHKPAGLPVHKTGKVFVNVLANLYREFKVDEAWTPLNRLDVETSGIVAFARGRESLRRFSPGTDGSVWTKTYLAVVSLPSSHSPALPDRYDGSLAVWPEHPIRSRMRVTTDVNGDGKTATTHFRTLLTSGDKALVLVRPVTGRKHQIRAHLADLGFPIVGDKVYSLDGRYYLERLQGDLGEDAIAALQAPHQLLHAIRLDIRDAEGNGITATDLDLPEPFRRFFPDATEEFLQDVLMQDLFSVVQDGSGGR
jgi:23S rRNA-/tRNA-specific pseudouridylate synthase